MYIVDGKGHGGLPYYYKMSIPILFVVTLAQYHEQYRGYQANPLYFIVVWYCHQRI